LSALEPVEAFVHGAVLRDASFDSAPISIGGRGFTTGVLTHPGMTPQGGRAEVVYALDGLLAKAEHFTAWVGIDDSAGDVGSCRFAVEVHRGDSWESVFESATLRGGDAPAEVNVDLRGADQLRLLVTDAGDGIGSDHATWGGAAIR